MDNNFIGITDDSQLNSSYSSISPEKRADKYAKYLLDGPKPSDNLHNSRNLFDDTNSEDNKWLERTRLYLRDQK